MGKITRKGQKRKADKLFSEQIRSLGYCELEGLDNIKCSGQLQTMHIIGRANHNLRWEKKNALCGCSGHHIYYTAHPFYFYELIEEKYPERFKWLRRHQNDIWDKDIEKVLEDLAPSI